jgi:hypothetical protein
VVRDGFKPTSFVRRANRQARVGVDERREAEHDHEAVTTAATILTQAAEGNPAWRRMAGIATLKAASRAAAFESDLQAVDQGERRGSENRSVLQTEMS